MRRTLIVPSLLLAACATAPAKAPNAAPPATSSVAVAPPATTPAVNAPPVASPKTTSAADLVDHIGDSVETAVSVPKDAPNDGLDWMNNWTFDRFGRFRRLIARGGARLLADDPAYL